MKKIIKNFYSRLAIMIFVISVIVSLGYMTVYSFNPLVQLFYLPKSFFMSMKEEPMRAPELRGIEVWLNSEPIAISELIGSVVLIDFWTYSCINCRRDAPFVNMLHEKYADKGLVVIGVHTPEFRYEKNINNVKEEAEKLNMEFPIAIDNDYKTFRAYGNLYWPAKYLIDKNGNIVYKRYGEGAHLEIENKITELLGE